MIKKYALPILILFLFFIAAFLILRDIEIEDNNEELSPEIIKLKIKEIIENEDKTNPLQDSTITNKLQEAGYPVNEETVIKYRKELDIPIPSKRHKNS